MHAFRARRNGSPSLNLSAPAVSGADATPAARSAGAPAVRHPVGRSRRLAALLGVPWLLGISAFFYMLFLGFPQSELALAALILIIALAFSGLTLRIFWVRQSARELLWDGAQWSLTGAGHDRLLAGVDVRLDLQRALLLRAQGRAGQSGAWLWAEAGADRGRWHLLRCALYSSGPASVRTALPAGTERP